MRAATCIRSASCSSCSPSAASRTIRQHSVTRSGVVRRRKYQAGGLFRLFQSLFGIGKVVLRLRQRPLKEEPALGGFSDGEMLTDSPLN